MQPFCELLISQPTSLPPRYSLRDLFAAMTVICVLAAATYYLGIGILVVGPVLAGGTLWLMYVNGQSGRRPPFINQLLGLGAIWAIVLLCLLPAVQIPRGPARRSECQNHVKYILLGIHNYESTYKHLPARSVSDGQGQATLSWRVEILPFLEYENLHQEFALDERWDSAHNLPLANQRPRIWKCPSSRIRTGTETDYYAAAGPNTAWEDGKHLRLAALKDGTSNVLLLVESHTAAVVWTEPRDLDLTSPVFARQPPASFVASAHNGVVMAGMADGSVRTVSSKIDPKTLKELADRRDGLPTKGWDE